MNKTILVVEDDKTISRLIQKYLSQHKYTVLIANTYPEATIMLEKYDIDMLLADLKLSDNGPTGLDLINYTHKSYQHVVSILMTGFGSIELAVKAIKAGAYNYISKPIKMLDLLEIVSNAFELDFQKNCDKYNNIIESEKDKYGYLYGSTTVMHDLFATIKKAANNANTVLIQGESGTGKELVARSIHLESDRSDAPFIPINCAALPGDLLESELFGHIKGAFTSASDSRKGLFFAAENGTIFLDEISEMPLHLQAKLLRVLEDKKMRPIGSDKECDIKARILAATNTNILQEVENNSFRKDLYYRLSVLTINTPALREHSNDINYYAKVFLKRILSREDVEEVTYSDSALKKLNDYNWPGNVRELLNVIERAFVFRNSNVITDEDIHLDSQEISMQSGKYNQINNSSQQSGLIGNDVDNLNITQVTKDLVLLALKETNGHKTKAANKLGVHPRTLSRMIKKFEIQIIN